MVELHRVVLPESPSCSSRTHVETEPLVRVTPEQVANGSFAGDFLNSIELSDVVEGFDVGRKSSVSSEDLSFNDCGKGQVVEELGEHLPHVIIFVLPHALVVKPVILGDASGLVIAPKDGQSFFIANFQAQQQADSLERVVSSVDVVSQE